MAPSPSPTASPHRHGPPLSSFPLPQHSVQFVGARPSPYDMPSDAPSSDAAHCRHQCYPSPPHLHNNAPSLPCHSTPYQISTGLPCLLCGSTPYHIPFAAPSSDAAPLHHSCYPPAVGPSFNSPPCLCHSTPYARPAVHSFNVKHNFNPTPSKEVDYNRSALLPHQILASAFCAPYTYNKAVAWMAEHIWERMVSDLRSTGKFRNSIVVYHRSTEMSEIAKQVSIAMALLISELSQPPWKWKVFDLEEDPYLIYLVDEDNILDKAKFLRRYFEVTKSQYYLDYEMVFKQILEVAKDAKLKQDEMIERVFVFTDGSFQSSTYHRAYVHDNCLDDSWKHEYKMLHSMFSKAGYAMPKIVFCNFHKCFTDNPWACSDMEADHRMPNRVMQMLCGMSDDLLEVCSDREEVQRMPDGVTQMVGGMSNDMLKLFLEKDAILTQKDIIEARGNRVDPFDE